MPEDTVIILDHAEDQSINLSIYFQCYEKVIKFEDKTGSPVYRFVLVFVFVCTERNNKAVKNIVL